MSKKNDVDIFLFGGTGDLAQKKLLPSLLRLFQDNRLSKNSTIISLGRGDLTKDAYLDEVNFEEHIDSDEKLDAFYDLIDYMQVDFDKDDQSYLLRNYEGITDNTERDKIYYLSLPASTFGDVSSMIKESGLLSTNGKDKVVFEKPFGYDLESATKINEGVTNIFDEEQIYRVDHYLGKELVQNMLMLRFSNPIFEQIWNGSTIDNIQITFAEHVGVGNRAEYYDAAGALRDMIQNHMLQVLSLTTMERPASLHSEEINKKKKAAIRNLSTPAKNDIVLGQYTTGTINGNNVKGYRQESNIPEDSTTETYAAIKTHLTGNHWNNTPVYLQTGKRLQQTYSEINIILKKDKTLFTQANDNVITIRMKPSEDIELDINAKQPHQNQITRAHMEYCHDCLYQGNTPQAYEVILESIIDGDKSMFIPWKMIQQSWTLIDQIYALDTDLMHYPAGTRIPEESHTLIENDSRNWVIK